jgi:nitrous oxide reductase accessory protein NosL
MSEKGKFEKQERYKSVFSESEDMKKMLMDPEESQRRGQIWVEDPGPDTSRADKTLRQEDNDDCTALSTLFYFFSSIFNSF